jgi:hypothetical protein
MLTKAGVYSGQNLRGRTGSLSVVFRELFVSRATPLYHREREDRPGQFEQR